MEEIYRRRRTVVALFTGLLLICGGLYVQIQEDKAASHHNSTIHTQINTQLATSVLETLEVKGRAPKTGYTRSQFGHGWRTSGDCNTRDDILARDMTQVVVKKCKVYSGVLDDPYTGKVINFTRGPQTSSLVQIDHVVALSDAWQKGAQYFDSATRENLANDPLELLAVDGKANQDKSDGDAATWLPPNKSYRCRYVARQIAVKQKYNLWVTSAEKEAMKNVLSNCPRQILPIQQ